MTDELVGTVAVEVTGQGSKSEMTSAVLYRDSDPAGSPVVLRRREATALSVEPELARYDGRRVRVRGVQGWSTFVVDSVEDLDPADVPLTDPGPDAG